MKKVSVPGDAADCLRVDSTKSPVRLVTNAGRARQAQVFEGGGSPERTWQDVFKLKGHDRQCFGRHMYA